MNLSDHKAAMVELLATGSAIPASASRLAHALHDVITVLDNTAFVGSSPFGGFPIRPTETTPGLNDKALAESEPRTPVDQPCVKPDRAEVRIKHLENTIKQLKLEAARRKGEIRDLKAEVKTATEGRSKLVGQIQNLGHRLDAWRGLDDTLRGFMTEPAGNDERMIGRYVVIMRHWGAMPAEAEPQRHGSGALTAAAVLKEDC